MKYEKVPKVVEGQRPKLTSTLIDDVISEDVQELAFSQDLSTVNGNGGEVITVIMMRLNHHY